MVRIARFVLMALACAALAGCAGNSTCKRDPKLGVCPSPRVVQPGEPVPKGGGRYVIGKPYVIGGRVYRPEKDPNYSEVGIASWYGDAFHGRLTANGEVFDSRGFSAAHTTLPIPSYVRVTNLANGRSMVVRVNDRGPYHSDRVIDVSSRVAHALKFRRNGLARVRVDYVRLAPLDGHDEWLAATLTDDGKPVGKTRIARNTPKKTKKKERSAAQRSRTRPKKKAPEPPSSDRAVAVAAKSPGKTLAPPAPILRAEAAPSAEGAPKRLATMLSRPIGKASGRRGESTPMERLSRLVITPPRPIGGSPASADSGGTPQRLAALISRAIGREPDSEAAAKPASRSRDSDRDSSGSDGGSKLYLQAGFYRNPDNAERLRKRLAAHGKVDVSRQGSLYRVRVGPIAPEAASAAVRAAERAGVVGARIAEF